MLSLAGMVADGDWWTGALVGKTLIGLFAPLGALVLLAPAVASSRRWRGVAAIVYISIPWIALVSMHGLVEGALAFYLFAALLRADAVAGREPSTIQRGERLVWLAGFLAGGAVATKYPAMLFCVLPLGVAIGYLSWVAGAHAHPPAPWSARLRPCRLSRCSWHWAADCGSPRTRR